VSATACREIIAARRCRAHTIHQLAEAHSGHWKLVGSNVRTKGHADYARPFVCMARVLGSSGETAQLPVHCGLARTKPIATLIMGCWAGGLISTPAPPGRAEG